MSERPNPSPHTADLLDAEVRRLVDQAHERATEALQARRPALDRIAKALLDTETLTAAELDRLVDPPAPVGRGSRARGRAAYPTVVADRGNRG